MTTSLITDNEQPRAFNLYLMLSATERMIGVVHDDHRWILARLFAADNFLRKFSDSDPFWLACDTFTDALPNEMRYFPALLVRRFWSGAVEALAASPVPPRPDR